MINNEDVSRGGCMGCGGQAVRVMPLMARAQTLSYDQACAQARQQMSALDPIWQNATCPEIAQNICATCSIFSGQNPIRLALTGSYNCPISPCPAPGTTPTGTSVLVIAGVGAAVVGLFWLALRSAGKKKLIIAPSGR